MRNVSFDSIVKRVRQRANLVGSQNPPDSDIMGYVADAFVQMYVRVMDASSSDFWWAYSYFNTQQGVNLYPLPVDHDRLRRVDSQAQGTPGSVQSWADVPRYDEALENTLGTPWGGTVMPSGQTIRIAYAPDAPVPQQYATLTFNSENGIDGLLFTATQAAQLGLNVSVQISTSGGSGTTIGFGSNKYQIIIYLKSGGDTIVNILAAYRASAQAMAVASIQSLTNLQGDSFTASVAAQNLSGVLQYNMPEGFDRYLVADASALVCSRLNRDGAAHAAERDKLEALITVRADKRDENQPQVAKDVQRERARMASPFYVQTANRFGYRIYGNQIRLAPYVQGGR